VKPEQGQAGIFIWDGTRENGKKANAGIYWALGDKCNRAVKLLLSPAK